MAGILEDLGKRAKSALVDSEDKTNPIGVILTFGLTAIGMILGNLVGGGMGIVLGGLLLGGLGLTASARMATPPIPPSKELSTNVINAAANSVEQKGNAIVLNNSGLDTTSRTVNYAEAAKTNYQVMMQPITELDEKLNQLDPSTHKSIATRVANPKDKPSRQKMEDALTAYEELAIKIRGTSLIEHMQGSLIANATLVQMSNAEFFSKANDAITVRRTDILRELQESQKNDPRSTIVNQYADDEQVYNAVNNGLKYFKDGNLPEMDRVVHGLYSSSPRSAGQVVGDLVMAPQAMVTHPIRTFNHLIVGGAVLGSPVPVGMGTGLIGYATTSDVSVSEDAKEKAARFTELYELTKLQSKLNASMRETSLSSLQELNNAGSELNRALKDIQDKSTQPTNLPAEAPTTNSAAALDAALNKGVMETHDNTDLTGFVPALSGPAKPLLDVDTTKGLA